MTRGSRQRPEKDPRDVVLDAARRWAAVEREVRELTRTMLGARCREVRPCWAEDTTAAWADPKQPIPDNYCLACSANTERARLRHAAKRRATRRRSVLLQAALALERSLWAEAVPLVTPRKNKRQAGGRGQAPSGRRRVSRGRRASAPSTSRATGGEQNLELFDDGVQEGARR